MKQSNTAKPERNDMEPEYDFAGAERGKFSERFKSMRLRVTSRSRRWPRAITPTEREVLRLLAQPRSISEVAERLSKRQKTLRGLVAKLSRLIEHADTGSSERASKVGQ